MGENGCVGWMFKRKGVFAIDAEAGYKEDDVMMIALDAGAEDMKTSEDGFEVVTQPEDFDAVEKALSRYITLQTVAAEINMVPDTMVSLQGEDAEKVQRTLDELEDLDDVQDVFSNADLPDLPDDEE
jgi:transcriptional/translational regulatory protein YebC/TACO1